MQRAWATVLLMCGALSAHALSVDPLTPAQLWDGADTVVEGQTLAVTAQWNAQHTGLETLTQIRVDRVLKGIAPPVVTLWQPGGTLDGARHIILGAPVPTVGERARYFLRLVDSPSPQPRHRIYGWHLGKWSQHNVPVPPYVLNGVRWPDTAMPVGYKVNPANNPFVTTQAFKDAIAAAFDTWAQVPCSSLRFQETGESDLGVAVDDQNVMLFLNHDWVYGDEAAGATAIWAPPGAVPTADIALNSVRFQWDVGPDPALALTTLDLQGVLTHEIGHFSGLTHTMNSHDTMYYSWKPWPGQRTLSLDDKQGLCSLYPVIADQCGPTMACPTGESCHQADHGTLCSDEAQPIGTPCNREVVECQDFCLLTAADWSTGYCSRFCTNNLDCPATHHCADAMAGTMAVKVCYEGAQPVVVDAGTTDAAVDEPDASSSPCGLCPRRTYCDEPSRTCSFDCRSHADCGGGNLCNDDGRCVPDPGNGDGGSSCGCVTGPSAAPLAALLWLLRRRRA
jgi:hypothetical protein